MNLVKLYTVLSQLTGFIGLGVVLGALLGDNTSTTPYWVGGILIFAGGILLGMSISSRTQAPPNNDPGEK